LRVLSDAGHDESLVDAKENSFSLREKARMRGYKISSYLIISPLPGPLPEGEGE
jgi:hypothetical protein